MTRYLPDILGLMISVIPRDTHLQLRIDLERLQTNSMFTAPEAMRQRWLEGYHILKHHIPDPSQVSDWQTKMMRIWRDEQTAKEGVTR